MGVPGPLQTIDRGDHRLLVEASIDNPRLVRGVDQLVIHDAAGVEHFFRLYPNINAEALKQKILQEIAPPPIPAVWLHCVDKQRGEEYEKLLRRMFPKGNQHCLPDTPVGMHPAEGLVHLTINQHYWQSIAKVGFHYYLAHNRRGVRGDEPGFAAIRNFVINGGDKSLFFHNPRHRFALPFGELPSGGIMTPTRWCHVLGADESRKEVVAYVHMFVGPACIPFPYYIILGTLDSDIVGLTSFIHGHVYLYDEQQNPTGTAGVVEAATATVYRSDRIAASVFVQ